MPVTDDEFIESVVAECRRVPNAEAVNLGGSRARGDFRPDSDWDFAVYPDVHAPRELAGSQVLWGDLPRPDYPEALRKSAPPSWLDRAKRELDYASYWANSANPISCAGALARVVLQGSHARLAHRGIWALNEKRMVQWADLTNLYGRFSNLGSSRGSLHLAIQDVRASIGEIETEVLDQP